ncbi:MAG: hypothetical protein F4Z74_05800 [Acidobacteria bacterium]|nr:hypothetical protein [Acidobacteriota bacterium]MYE42548.1 hypothetical protein [Acidobacteriota bacterium]
MTTAETREAAARPASPNARRGGLFLIASACATVVSVITRVAPDADQPALAESLAAIAERAGLYGMGGASRLIAGACLVFAARHLLKTWIIRERNGTPLVPNLLAVSGVLTAISGAVALGLAAGAPEPAATVEAAASLRRLSGLAGFSVAGLALIVAARYQWKAGVPLRLIAPVSLLLGTGMQLIWSPAATGIHGVTGGAFVVWLTLVGVMLLTGRVERRFAGAQAPAGEADRRSSR